MTIYRILTASGDREIKPGEHWMAITQGMSGWFAVELWLNNEEPGLGPFPEPWDTGIGRYATPEEAYAEAGLLAMDLGLPLERVDRECSR